MLTPATHQISLHGSLHRLGRILWRSAWLVQALLWLMPLVIITVHYMAEKPRIEKAYSNGLENSFNGMAGIIAAIAPDWETVRTVKGHGVIPFLDIFLDRSMAFDVWLDMDERKGWFAGNAAMRYDKNGHLEWVGTTYGSVRNLRAPLESPTTFSDNLRPAATGQAASKALP